MPNVQKTESHPILNYEVDEAALPEPLRKSFIPSETDQETIAYLEECRQRPHSRWGIALARILSLVLPAYEVHGLLKLFPMHLLSVKQWEVLVGDKSGGSLLDIGAGQGFVTERARDIFQQISVTETSRSMARILREKGFDYREQDIDTIASTGELFDVVSILNVIDRCERPLSLLKSCISLLKKDGYILLATPLPLRPYVRKAFLKRSQSEALPHIEDSWERCLIHFNETVVRANGLEIVRWTRLPYFRKATAPTFAYSCDDAVLVCKKLVKR